jgi:hypothetical protein
MRLTKDKIRQAVREEVQKLDEKNVRTMDGTVSFFKQAKGNYLLTIEKSSGEPQSVRMSQDQAEALHQLIMNKV